MGVVGLTSHLQRGRGAAQLDLLRETRRRPHSHSPSPSHSQPHSPRCREAQPACGASDTAASPSPLLPPPASHPLCSSPDSEADVSRYLSQHSGCRFLLLDGLGVFHALSGLEPAVGRALPCYDALHCRVAALVLSLAQQRIRLVAYFDSGSTESSKRSEGLRRSRGRLAELIGLSRALSSARIASFSPLRCASAAADEDDCQSHSPQLLQRQVLWTLRLLGVCVVLCEQEADLRLSEDARRFSSQVLGVVSNDSDCAIMRGVRWIPIASLVLRWAPALPGQPGVEVDADMRAFFSSARPQGWMGGRQPSLPHTTAASQLSAPSGPLRLTHASCSAWSNADVAAALLLPSVSQLVELALLVGNDFTREFTASWDELLPRIRGSSRIGRCVAFLKQQQPGLRFESMPALQQRMQGNRQLRRAVRLSRAIYDGELLPLAEGAADGDVDSLTSNLDALQLPAADLAAVRGRVAAGLCSADTLSVVARDHDMTRVYLEQVREAPPSYAEPTLGTAPVDFSSLLLPDCEQVTRLLRAAFALLCGRSSQAVAKVVGREFRQVEADIQYGQLLPDYTLPVLAAASASTVGQSRLPLLLVAQSPLHLRIRLFCRPFAALPHIASASQDISEVLLLSSPTSAGPLPLTLRLPVLACRFLLHSYCSQGVSLALVQPLLDSLLCMALLLHALMPAMVTPPPSSPASPSPSAAGALLRVVDSHRASFPLMLAVGLSSHYQSVCSKLSDLSSLLQLPPSCLPPLSPDRLYHGPLLLSLLQDAIPQPSAPSPCRSSSALDLLRYRVVSQQLSVSSMASSHQALQAVTSIFRRFHATCRQCVFQRRLEDAAIATLDVQPKTVAEANRDSRSRPPQPQQSRGQRQQRTGHGETSRQRGRRQWMARSGDTARSSAEAEH